MKKKVFGQIFKEFRYPLAIAIIWTVINYQFFNLDKLGQPKKPLDYLNILFASFFFISYFFGQFFRVKKQLGVEQNLTTVESKLVALTMDLETKTNHLVNYVTGGDSYFYYRITQNLSPDLGFMLEAVFVGEYPINNLRIFFMGRDVNVIDNMWELKNINKNVPNRANQQIKLKFSHTAEYQTSFVFGADNKSWVQRLEMRKNNLTIDIKSTVYLNNEQVLNEEYQALIVDWPPNLK